MKVTFLGYGKIGAAVLTGLVTQHEVIVAVTHESSFGGLGRGPRGLLVEPARAAHAVRAQCGRGHVVRAIKDCEPEVLVSANWRTTVPELVLEIAQLGRDVDDTCKSIPDHFGRIATHGS
jgi:methionyl-tRNA formyltransferase